MKRIFLSRELRDGSPFRQLIDLPEIELIAQSLIDFQSLDFEMPPADCVFVYSPRGAQEFILLGVEQPKLLAAMGKRTAQILNKQFRVDYIGNGKAQAIATDLQQHFLIETISFIEAQNSLKSVEKLLSDSIQKIPVVAYSNTPKTIQLPDIDIAILTSPMNVEAFSRSTTHLPEAVIAIGQTTAQAVRELLYTGLIIAEQQSEEAMYKALIDLLD